MTDQINSCDPAELLKRSRVEVAPEIFTVLSLTHEEWLRVLEDPALSPRMLAPFLIFKDKWEVTLVLDEQDVLPIRQFISSAPAECNFRLLSFDTALNFDAVGFIERVASIFAEAGISILPFSSYSRDHVMVKQDDLAKGLKALRGHVSEVC